MPPCPQLSMSGCERSMAKRRAAERRALAMSGRKAAACPMLIPVKLMAKKTRNTSSAAISFCVIK